jgi:hypothetical protein
MAKKYDKVNRNKLNLVYGELNEVREEFKSVCLTPIKDKNELIKQAELTDLDKEESYLIMQLVKIKGMLKPGRN